MPYGQRAVEGYSRHLNALGVERLSISEERALPAWRLDWAYRDPVDRLLAAGARIEWATPVTMDPDLTALAGLATLP